MSRDYDVIVIGSGAGGGTLVRRLAPSGKRILLLERGGWLPREPANWGAHEVFVDNRYVSADTWYDADGTPFQPQVHYFVGGATKLYGAALYRLRREDFGELQRARDLMERLLRIASPLGLYAEEFDAATGHHLGNFPQAFSHLALIQAAARIILAERLPEFTS